MNADVQRTFILFYFFTLILCLSRIYCMQFLFLVCLLCHASYLNTPEMMMMMLMMFKSYAKTRFTYAHFYFNGSRWYFFFCFFLHRRQNENLPSRAMALGTTGCVLSDSKDSNTHWLFAMLASIQKWWNKTSERTRI